MTLEELVSAGESMQQELGLEYYLTHAGHKCEPEFQKIYDKHCTLLEDGALETVRASGSRALLEWLVELRSGRKTAKLDEEQLLREQNTELCVSGRRIDYLKAPIELANSPDRRFRIALDHSRASVKGLDEIRRQRFSTEHEEIVPLGLGDYVEAMGALSGIDLDELGISAARFLEVTEHSYADRLAELAHRRLDLQVSELVRADVAWAFRADQYDSAFTPEQMVETAVLQMNEMGMDATAGGRISFDTEERSGKNPRAFCVPVRVPAEVYLVLRPQGGHGDYRTFWHELGHAIHFASMSGSLPFEARWLGDNSVTEGFAMLWDHMTVNRLWLERYTDLSKSEVDSLCGEFAVQELYMTRRYAAKLLYELAFHRSDFSGLGPEYAKRLTSATLFQYPGEDYLSDVDPGFYCARYIRAWQLEAVLASVLTERFDEDWFRNPRAGEFVRELMRRGQDVAADELASSVMGASLSFDPLLKRLEG